MKERMKQLLLILLVAMAATSCADKPRIDGSSDETMKESLRKITDSLSDVERDQFVDAYKTLLFQTALDGGDMAAFRKRLDKKTAAQVIDMRNKLPDNRKENQ